LNEELKEMRATIKDKESEIMGLNTNLAKATSQV
jgi:hypothetical protein